MKFVIEFGDDDLVKFLDEFGDDLKEGIKKRLKDALIEEELNKQVKTYYPVSKKVFDTKEEAEEILNELYDILLRFNNVTVYDYYELVDIERCDNDRNYGWTDLKGVRVRPYTYGNVRWTIELPKPVRLHRYDQVK